MRISDWSSDVCSSDLEVRDAVGQAERIDAVPAIEHDVGEIGPAQKHAEHRPLAAAVERDELALDHMILDPAAFDQLDDALERLDRLALGTEIERDQIGIAVRQHRDRLWRTAEMAARIE